MESKHVVVSEVKTSKQNVKTGEKITIQVRAYTIRAETGGYYLAIRLGAPKLKT